MNALKTASKLRSHVHRVEIAYTLVVAVLASCAGVMLSTLPLQFALPLLILAMVGALFGPSGTIITLAILAPFQGLFKRITAYYSGETSLDLLTPLLVLMAAIAVLQSIARDSRLARFQIRDDVGAATTSTAVAALFAIVSLIISRSFAIDPVYWTLLFVTPLILIYFIARGYIDDVWPKLQPVIPVLGLLNGGYAIYQFFNLPPWDERWIRESDMKSLGIARPMEFRVFGASESPGPFAFFMGLALLVSIYLAIKHRGITRVWWAMTAVLITFPILISGVRTVLIALIACGALLTLLLGKGWARLLPAAFFGAIGYGLLLVIERFGQVNSVLDASRYTEFDSASDPSFQARIALFRSFSNPLRNIMGNPSSAASDNQLIDVLNKYGLISAAALTFALIIILVIAVRSCRQELAASAPICAIYICITMVSGSVFLSAFGFMSALVFGSLLSGWNVTKRGSVENEEVERQ